MRRLACATAALIVSLTLCSCSTSRLGGLNSLDRDDQGEIVLPAADVLPMPADSPDTSRAVATPAMEQSLQAYAAEHPEATGETEDDSWVSDEFAASVPADLYETRDNTGNLSNAIIGSDDRVTVSDTYQYPYSAIAYMGVHARCGCEWGGTGFMVSEDVLLTAGHCICCTKHHKSADQIELYFGYHTDGSYAYGYFGPTEYWYGTDFPDGYTDDILGWDYAVVKLEENVGDYTGWLGMSVKKDSDFDNTYYRVAGYRDGVLKYDTDRTKVYNDRAVLTYADTLAGNSGGPIYNGDSASAIYIAENNSGRHNVGCRITTEIFNKVLEADGKKPIDTDKKDDKKDDKKTELVVDPFETGPDGYILPYAQTHYYTTKEVKVLSTWGLYVARNEISARHGYKFKNSDLRDYFGSKNWYHGTLTGEEFRKREGILSKVEEANINTILALEKKRGSTYVL